MRVIWLSSIAKSKSKTFLAFCFCFILGAGAASFLGDNKISPILGIEIFYLYILLFAVLFFTIIFWHKQPERLILLCLLFFILGGLRFLISIPSHNSSRIEFYNGEKIILQGWVSQEPDIGIGDAQYIVSVTGLVDKFVIPTASTVIPSEARADEGSLSVGQLGQRSLTPQGGFGMTKPTARLPAGRQARDDRKLKPVSGKIIVKNRLYPQYNYGDELEISCFLQEPKIFTDSKFNYPKYLAKQGVWSVCANPEIETRPHPNLLLKGEGVLEPSPVRRGQGEVRLIVIAVYKKILRLKSGVGSQMAKLWPEPESSLMAGLLYGSKSGLPKEMVDNFSRTGVSHIVAVSGYNVSIIAVVLSGILIYLGLSRRKTFWLLVLLIFTFVFFTGATASVVRAGVMAMIILVAQYMGRLSSVGRTLVYAAVIMLLFNPYLLVWDVGFQLSFLSTLGLVYLLPILSSAISAKLKSKNDLVITVVEILATTLSAIIATTPLIMYQFGRFSLVAPLVNILILWLVPWLMLFGFLSLLVGFLFFPFGQLIAWITGIGLRYVIMMVDWFGSKSWSAVSVQIPLWVMMVMYLVIIYVIMRNRKQTTIPPPPSSP